MNDDSLVESLVHNLQSNHPLVAELTNLRSALARYQNELHSISVKLQRSALETSQALDRAHRLERTNEVLRTELLALRSNPDTSPHPASVQVTELSLALRHISDKLTDTEDALLSRTHELSHAQAELRKSRLELDDADKRVEYARKREALACSYERDARQRLQAKEEEHRLTDFALQEYAELVRKLEFTSRSPHISPNSLASEDFKSDVELPGPAAHLEEGRTGLRRLMSDFHAETSRLETEMVRLHNELADAHSSVAVTVEAHQNDRAQLASLQLEIEKNRIDNNTSAKMVSRYMKFSQQSTNNLQNALGSLKTRHAASLDSLSSQLAIIERAYAMEQATSEQLRTALDEMASDIAREAFGRRREVALRLGAITREERVAEGLKRWRRRAGEHMYANAADGRRQLDVEEATAKMLADADKMLLVLHGESYNGTEEVSAGTTARIALSEDTANRFMVELEEEIDRWKMFNNALTSVPGRSGRRKKSTLAKAERKTRTAPVAKHLTSRDTVTVQKSVFRPSAGVGSPDSESPAKSYVSMVDTSLPQHHAGNDTLAVMSTLNPPPIIEDIVHRQETINASSQDKPSSHQAIGTVEALVEFGSSNSRPSYDGEETSESTIDTSIPQQRPDRSPVLDTAPAGREVDSSTKEPESASTFPGLLDHILECTIQDADPPREPIKADLSSQGGRDNEYSLNPEASALAEAEPLVESIPIHDKNIDRMSDTPGHPSGDTLPEPISTPGTCYPPQQHSQPEDDDSHSFTSSSSPESESEYVTTTHCLLDELQVVSKRYAELSRAFHDCHLALRELKDSLTTNPSSLESNTLTTLQTVVNRLDDVNEDVRVELEIQIADEERLVEGYTALLSLPGHFSVLEPSEQEQMENEIRAFVSGEDSKITRALATFNKKRDELEHDVADAKRVVHNLAAGINLSPPSPEVPLSSPNPDPDTFSTPSDSLRGRKWSNWTNGLFSSSRPSSPAPPTFGNVMTTPRLRSSASNASLASQYSSHGLTSTEHGANTTTPEPFARLGLHLMTPMPSHLSSPVTRSLTPLGYSHTSAPRPRYTSMFAQPMLGVGGGRSLTPFGHPSARSVTMPFLNPALRSTSSMQALTPIRPSTEVLNSESESSEDIDDVE